MAMYGNPNQVFEYFSDSDAITCEAAANLTGCTLVKLAPGGEAQRPKVTTCGAGEAPYGVAAWDVKAGQTVTILRKGVVSVKAGAAVTPGRVQSDAAGKVVPLSTGQPVGHAHADAATNTDAAVALNV